MGKNTEKARLGFRAAAIVVQAVTGRVSFPGLCTLLTTVGAVLEVS